MMVSSMTLTRYGQWWVVYVLVLSLGWFVAVKQHPFSMPDEGAHYLRAYEVSRGHLVNWRGDKGVEIRCDEYLVIAQKYHLIAWLQVEAQARQAEANCTVKSVNSAGAYSFVPYVPAAVSLRLAETMGVSLEQRLVFARSTNFFIWFTVIFVGLMGIHKGRAVMVCLVSMPAFFWQLFALSVDGAVLAASLLYFSIVVRTVQENRPTGYKVLYPLSACAILLGASKGVYAPLCLFSLAIWPFVPPLKNWGLKLAALLVPTVAALFAFAVFASISDPSLVYLGHNANPAQQMNFIVGHPLDFLSTVLSVVRTTDVVALISPGYAVPVAGRGLGIAIAWLASSLVLLFFSDFGINKMFRALAAALVVILFVAVCLPLYLTYNPPGHTAILGLQGRYYLPIIPLLFAAVGMNASSWNWSRLQKGSLWLALPAFLALVIACFNVR